jgi:uncharacterized protein YraI
MKRCDIRGLAEHARRAAALHCPDPASVDVPTFSAGETVRIGRSTRSLFALAAALGIAGVMTFDAQAQAVTASAVNVRAGPDRFFPTVTWVLSGTEAKVHGCVDSWRWCDVTVGRDRGWIYSRYLSVPHEGTKVTILRGGPALGMPAVPFDLGDYWKSHYADRRWFGQAAQYQTRWERRRPQAPWAPPRSAN